MMTRAGYFSEAFCRNMAWVDLILLANHDDNFFRARGIRIDVKRGQVGYGLDELGKRWKWSRGKVERFMKELETDETIIRQKNNVTTLISIVNYSQYQDSDKPDAKAEEKPKSKADGTQAVKQTNANKNYKNSKNDNNSNKISPPSRGEKKPDKKTEETRPHWQPLVDTWFEVYKSKKGDYPSFPGKDVKEFSKLYDLLQLRAKRKLKEWTEDYAVGLLKYFLEAAFLDNWLKDHFLLEQLVKQFDAVIARENERKAKKPQAIPLNDELQYIVDRYSDGDLDDRLLTPELYKRMEEKKLIPEGYREKFDAISPDIQKQLAIKAWLEKNKKQTA